MNYPLHLRFRILTIGNQIYLTDSADKEIIYIEQKIFALRESVKVYNNRDEKKQIYGIKTKKVIDFGAEYFFFQGEDETKVLGSLKEEGLKSILKASYIIRDSNGKDALKITEKNPWVKLFDLLFSLIPYADFLTGYIFHPVYEVTDLSTNHVVMTFRKEASFWERQFIIDEPVGTISKENETNTILGIIMLLLLQRNRG